VINILIDKDVDFFRMHRSIAALEHSPLFAFREKGQWFRCFVKEQVLYLSKVDNNKQPKDSTVLLKPPYEK